MNNNIKNLIIESIESNRDLFFLMNIISKKFSEKFLEKLPRMKDNFDFQGNMVLLYINPIFLYYDDIKSSNDFSQNLKNAMKRTNPLKIYLQPQTDGTKDKGGYDRPTKTINVNLSLTSPEMETYLERTDRYAFEDLFRNAKSTLIHELKHWYDDITTNGRVFDDLKSKRYYDEKVENRNRNEEEKKKFYERYLKLNHEISARFAQIMQDLYFTRIDSLQDMVNYFEDNFVGWKILNNKQQRGLIRKASQLYWERIKHRNNTLDISSKIKEYKNKKKEEGYSIILDTNTLAIELDRLENGDKVRVIKDLIRLSEIYRKYLIIHSTVLRDIDKFTLKKLGIVANKGKNLDYRIDSGEYYRIPRRLKK